MSPSRPPKHTNSTSTHPTPTTSPAAGASPAAPPPSTAAPSTTAAPKVYTLKSLAALVGDVSEAAVLRLVEGYGRDELVVLGAEYATSRISKDCSRDYGRAWDWYATATEEQKDLLPALSVDLLRTAIWAARRGEVLDEAFSHGGTVNDTTDATRQAEAIEARKRGKACRNQQDALLRTVAGGHAALLALVDGALGTAPDDKALADSIARQVALGRTWLASTDPGIVERRAGTRLRAELLDRHAALAEEVRDKGAAAEATRTLVGVTQADVNYWDGINLTLYRRIVEIFEAGRDSDPTILRLSPIALRRFFSFRRRKSEGGGDTGGEGGDTGGGGGDDTGGDAGTGTG